MSLVAALLFGAGVVLLIWGADLLVRGGARPAAPVGAGKAGFLAPTRSHT